MIAPLAYNEGAFDGGAFDGSDPDIRMSVAAPAGGSPAPAPGFYSQLARAVERAPARIVMDGQQWQRWLDANAGRLGVKQAELEWSGIREYLQLHEGRRLAAGELLGYLADNGVQVEEVIKGSQRPQALTRLERERNDLVVQLTALGFNFDLDMRGVMTGIYRTSGSRELFRWEAVRAQFVSAAGAAAPTEVHAVALRLMQVRTELEQTVVFPDDGERGTQAEYSTWTLPGGARYRELLLKLPVGRSEADFRNGRFLTWLKQRHGLTREQALRQWESALAQQKHEYLTEGVFLSGHWNERNVLAHVRLDERRDDQGKRVLFVGELQSDWAQTGRREGFRKLLPDIGDEQSFAVASTELQWHVSDPASGRSVAVGKGVVASASEARVYAARYFRGERRGEAAEQFNQVPPGPFVDKTQAWLTLALKRVLRLAVDEGFDRVAFITGEQAASTFKLGKFADAVRIAPGGAGGWDLSAYRDGDLVVAEEAVPTERLQDYFGKAIADKLLVTPADAAGVREISQERLKVGIRGMRAFYDRIVPAAVERLLGQVGGERLGQARLEWMQMDALRADAERAGTTLGDLLEVAQGAHYAGQQPAFDITPRMRERLMGEGLPLFSVPAAPAQAGFYSQLQRAIERLPSRGNARTGRQWWEWLQANAPRLAIKQDEVEWSGVERYLQLRASDKVTREDLAGWLGDYGVRVNEVVLGDSIPAGTRLHELHQTARVRALTEGEFDELEELEAAHSADHDRLKPPKFAAHTLGRGGRNYREILLTLPSLGMSAGDKRELTLLRNKLRERRATFEEAERYEQLSGELADERTRAKAFHSKHWSEPNVIVHLRVDDRFTADGKRILFVNEIQSDWAQNGRKSGFRPSPRELARMQPGSLEAVLALARGDAGVMTRVVDDGFGQPTIQEFHPQPFVGLPADERVPAGPFVSDTAAWVSLAVKRVMARAAREGYDGVAFITGDQAARVMRVKRELSEVIWSENGQTLEGYDANGECFLVEEPVRPEELAQFLGEDLARRLQASAPDQYGTRRVGDCRVEAGGNGMYVFYDQIVPQVAARVLKSVGARLGSFHVQGTSLSEDGLSTRYLIHGSDLGDLGRADTLAEAEQRVEDLQRRGVNATFVEVVEDQTVTAQPGFEVSASMRERVGQGLPLFSLPAQAPGRTKLSNAQVGKAFARMAAVNRELFEEVLFNWEGGAYYDADAGDIYGYPGRNRQFDRGADGGKRRLAKKDFLQWLASEEPLDPGIYDVDEQWRRSVSELREIAQVGQQPGDAALCEAISAALKTERFWRLIVDATQAGPFDGGCLVAAQALLRAAGQGDLVALRSAGNPVEHYGARIGGVIYDFAGPASTGELWASRFAFEEQITDRELVFDEHPDLQPDVPQDPDASEAIAGLLRECMARADREPLAPRLERPARSREVVA